MTWELALQSLFVLGSSIGTWFLYDLVKEFKEFKKETGRDISNLKRERELFQQVVRGSELSMNVRVMELNTALENSRTHVERGLGIIDNELSRIRLSIERGKTNYPDQLKIDTRLNLIR